MGRNHEPVLARTVVDEWAVAAQIPKPTARGTMLRYSGAHGCFRRMAYDWFEAEYTNPPTPASVIQANMGTLFGEAQAAAQIRKFGGEAERTSQINHWLSGSADWFGQVPEYGDVVYENKMKSGFAFNKAMGYKRGYGRVSRNGEDGPPLEAVVQAGLNAIGISMELGRTVEWVIVGVLSTDVLSVNEARQIDATDTERFCGEWAVPIDVFEPWARREIARLEEAYEIIDYGNVPPTIAIGDGGVRVELDPEGKAWQCGYCPYRALCAKDGEGFVPVTQSALIRRPSTTETKE